MILKKRLTRVIAFIISCALIGICVFQCIFMINADMAETEKRNDRSDLMESYEYTHDLYGLFDRLWAVSSIYLRNTDSRDRFTCKKEYEKSAKQALKELGLMDEKGSIVIDDPRGFEYYACCGDRSITNTKKSPDELKGSYSIAYINGIQESWPLGVRYGHSIENQWYTTNYGVTYYMFSEFFPKRGAALYDYDTEGLDSYTDERGVRIYYKTDGTTPVPESSYGNRYDENISLESADRQAFEQFIHPEDTEYVLPDESYEHEESENTYEEKNNTSYVGDMSEVTDTDVYMFYDEDSGKWFKVSKNRFQKYKGDNSDISIYIRPSDSLIAEYEQYSAQREQTEQDIVHKAMPLIPVGIAGFIIGLLLLFCCGYDDKKKKFALSMPDHIFAELPVLFIIGAVLSAAAMAEDGISALRQTFDNYYTDIDMGGIVAGSAVTACYAIGLGSLITLSTRAKCRSLLKTSLTGRLLAFMWRKVKKLGAYMRRRFGRRIEKNSLKKDLFARRFLIRTAIALAAEFVLAVIALPYPSRSVEAFIFGSLLVLVLYVVFSLRDHSDIAGVAKQIADMNGGDYSPRTVPENSPAYGMTNNLNNISDGIRHAVDKQVQSERMKIELVTNVSHDLKTPLTSIISYIDLLSAEEMSPAAKDYVSIISQKSDRLKAMVSDLFDLAKATSHTDVNSEQIDAVILTQQVLGDMADRIALSGRDVRTDIKAQSAPITAEGKKLYRVLQNLIDNALKYSMDGTRIYVTLSNNGGYTDIAVKNISAEEMDFTPEEITERFTRGDKSRTTEGNGLGLSIAKSFTEACGGNFEVVIDGDMFTAHVRLPLTEKTE